MYVMDLNGCEYFISGFESSGEHTEKTSHRKNIAKKERFSCIVHYFYARKESTRVKIILNK